MGKCFIRVSMRIGISMYLLKGTDSGCLFSPVLQFRSSQVWQPVSHLKPLLSRLGALFLDQAEGA